MWDAKGRLDHRWAAGSYLDFLLASALMLFVFIAATGLMFQSNYAWYVENMDLVEHIGYIIAAMGWMAAIMLAIGFGLLPFVHQSAPYDKSILRLCIALNISGQACLIAALFTFNRESIIAFGTVGVTLLSLQFIVIGGPARQLLNDRNRDVDPVAGFSSLMPLAMPIVGVLCLLSWLAVEVELSRLLFEAILIDVFLPMVCVGAFLGHFNRRLGWDITSREGAHRLFLVLLFLGLVHVVSVWMTHINRFSDPRLAYTLPLLYTVAFLGCRPDRIWHNVVAKRPHSHLILAAYWWILAAILMSVIEIREGVDPLHGRHIMLLGVGTMTLWGFAHWMHYDHCHIPLDKRSAGWPLLIGMSLAIVFYFAGGMDVLGLMDVPNWGREAALIMAVIGMGYPAIWWFWETFFHHGEWHRIPMFYGNLHEEADPYELGREE
ncbi:MAG TPA: hypothetical protein EYQ80_00300 [Candidatus Poseidoniales archaeon]|nr:hypothetical protein [Candidatus Poseidoniales archaeon]